MILVSLLLLVIVRLSSTQPLCDLEFLTDTRITIGTSLGTHPADHEQCQKDCCDDINCIEYTWHGGNFCLTYSDVVERDNDENSLTARKVFTPKPTMPSTPVPTQDPITVILAQMDRNLEQMNTNLEQMLVQIDRLYEPNSFCDNSFFPGLGDHPAVIHNDIMYSIGMEIYTYDIYVGVWSGPILVHGDPHPATGGHSATLVGDVVYVCGGSGSASGECSIFDIPTKAWSSFTSSFTPRRIHSAVSIGEFIYFSGGSLTSVMNSHQRFDIVDNSWLEMQPMIRGLYGHTAVVFESDIYIFGGQDGSSYRNEVYMFDITASERGEWSQLETFGTLPLARVYHASVVFGGRMFVYGGVGGSGSMDDLFMFEFESRFWSRLNIPNVSPSAQYAMSFAVHDSQFYFFGGLSSSTATQFCVLTIGRTSVLE